jgi:magnesium and cobalt exporter, CNNM family
VHTVAGATTAFIVITFLHIVLGELTPKAIALVKAEGVSRYLVVPLMVFAKVMSPAISVLYGAANVLLRRFGISPQSDAHHVHSPEELRLLVMQARAHGTLDETDSAMLAGVFDFHEKKAYDVMRPRTEVAALDIDSTEEEVWAVVRRERYSRYPVYRETLDDVAGVFLAKDLWLHDGTQPFSLKEFVRAALYVPSSKPAERVLDDLRKTRAQMAVVLDEYGGTAGILTMEDLVEEVVGDITDEYDFASRTAVMMDGVLELAGSLSLVDVRSDYGLRIPEGDWSTLGGYAFGRLGRLPKIGDRVEFPGGKLEIIALEGRRVAGLRVHRDNPDKVTATSPAGAAAH